MDPPDQPLSRWLCRRFWEFQPFLALVEAIAFAIYFQSMAAGCVQKQCSGSSMVATTYLTWYASVGSLYSKEVSE